MKDKFISIFIFMCLFFCIDSVKALNPNAVVACYEDTSNLYLRSTSTGNVKTGELECGEKVEILKSVEVDGSCSYKFEVTNGKSTGYVCGHYLITTVLTDYAKNYYSTRENVDTYKQKLKEAGFPDSYIPYLLETHARHPEWAFIADNIKFTWDEVINGEYIKNRNLVYYTFDPNYRSTDYGYDWKTDTYYRADGEPNWYNVSKSALKFYMDPRNYLSEKYIFAFETLGFNEGIHSVESVQGVLKDSFVPRLYSSYYNGNKGDGSSLNYANDVFLSGNKNGVSPLHLATRILLENGADGSKTTSGAAFTYKDASWNIHSASGYFNFYNIGSYASDYNDNGTNGLVYAMGGLNKTDTSYNRPWNTPYKAIYGGAMFLAGGYISAGQYTLYYEKFDVPRSNSSFAHQFQQNVTAQVNEGGKTYNGYYKVSGVLDNKLYFNIPVYKNMTNEVSMAPVLGSQNNYLKDLKINGKTVDNFEYNKTSYKVFLPLASTSIDISATPINSSAKIGGSGKIQINSNNSNLEVVVTAGNGDKRTYTINVVREDDPKISVATILDNSSVKYNANYIFGIKDGTNVISLINNVKNITNYAQINIKDKNNNIKTNDVFKTGDKVSITSNGETKNYEVIIYGDVDGDGEITKLDYLAVLRHYYNYTKYSGVYEKAADANKDGVVDKLDYLAILRDYYGYADIVQ